MQVTLQIIRALIEKTPRDLPLYIHSVLSIFKQVLASKDVTLIEESLPTFETFCSHQDSVTLAANQEFMTQYLDIIRSYAKFASKDNPIQTKTTKSIPVLIRFRKAGLSAIRALAASEILNADTLKQMQIMIPPLLENIYTTDSRTLVKLGTTEEEQAEVEKQNALRRRQSTNVVRPKEEEVTPDPVAASGTVEDADQIAEQEVAVLALQALKQIFSSVPRSQLRMATEQVFGFTARKVRLGGSECKPDKLGNRQIDSWSATLFSMLCKWAPVQDRFVIVVSCSEMLIRSPIAEDDFERQRNLALIMGRLLGSEINFIGLSIMDILIGLLHHMLALLQVGRARTDSIASTSRDTSFTDLKGLTTSPEINRGVLSTSIALLEQLESCIGSLAVHIYYSDQVIDMVHAILIRLKPSLQSAVPLAVDAIENPMAAAESVGAGDKTHHHSYFASSAARMLALTAVKEIIFKANTKRDSRKSDLTSRTLLSVTQWEGTQWLLRDPGFDGRLAYAQALLFWMRYELKKVDLRVIDDFAQTKKDKKDASTGTNSLARRAVSNASQREKSPLRRKETFLQLLHLAIYENALSYADSECDILLLHLLLSNLTQKLGVNAVRHGLPMIMRLQEEIPNIESPLGKVHVGSLVHGYLWAVSFYFDFDNHPVGRMIESEIQRRTHHHSWTTSVRVPPLSLEQILQRAKSTEASALPAETIAHEALKPFDNREAFVSKIADGYSSALHSPPSSPPQSPVRSYSRPVVSGGLSRTASSMSAKPPPSLSQKAKDAMMEEWTREACIAATGKSDGSRTGSLSGSPTGTTSSKYHLTANGNPDGTHSPTKSQQMQARSLRPTSAAFGFVHLPGTAQSQHGRTRRASQSPTPLTTSSIPSAVRVEDLKAVLSGSQVIWPITSSGHDRHRSTVDYDHDDTASESMASYEGSEISLPLDAPQTELATTGEPLEHVDTQRTAIRVEREGSLTPRPLTAVSTIRPPSIVRQNSNPDDNVFTESDSQNRPLSIPPVPPLPMNINLKSAVPTLVNIPAPKRSIASSTTTSPTKQPSAYVGGHGGGKSSVPSSRPQSRKSVRLEENPVLYSSSKSLVSGAPSIHESSDHFDYAMMSPPKKGPRAAVNVGKLLDEIDADAGFGVGIGRSGLSASRPPY